MKDYQWPAIDLEAAVTWPKWENAEIESHFEAILGRPVMLAPSGRSALRWCVEAEGIGRSGVVFAPKWASPCVWGAVTPMANPSIVWDGKAELVVAIHKYALVHRVPAAYSGVVVEDSVDSFFVDGSGLFPNDGKVELLSLPKILGAAEGGLVVFADAGRKQALAAWRKERRIPEIAFVRGPGAFARRWRECRDTLADRMERAFRRIPSDAFLAPGPGRLPPVLAVELCGEELPQVDYRVVDRNRAFDRPDFRKTALLPLHAGVSDEEFARVLDRIAQAHSERRGVTVP